MQSQSGGLPEDINNFECSGFLSLQSVGIHRVHQGDWKLICCFTNDVEGTVKIASDGEHFGSVHQGLCQLPLGNVSIRDQHEGPHPSPSGVGRGCSTGIPCTGTNDRLAASLFGFADRHRHSAIFERSGGVEAVVLHEDSNALSDALSNGGNRN
jgi:hypothetical protein